MDKEILVPVNRFIKTMSRAEVHAHFGMPVPTHVKLYLKKALVEKLLHIQKLLKENKLAEIKIISSYRQDKEHSRTELYYQDQLIKSSIYEDFDRDWQTFDDYPFIIVCSSSNSDKFYVTFLYASGNGLDFSFRTDSVSVST